MDRLGRHVDRPRVDNQIGVSILLGKTVAERMNPSSWDAISTRVYPRLDLSLSFFLFLFLLFPVDLEIN